MADNDIDLEKLQESIDESQIDTDQEHIEETHDEIDVDQEIFDLDSALDSYEAIELDGKVTEDEAAAKAKERGWNPEGKDKYGHSVSAIEFLERTPLFHKMDLMRGDVEDLKKQNRRIIEQNKKIAQSKIDSDKKHVEELKAQKEQLLNTEVLDQDDIKVLRQIDNELESKARHEPAVDENEIVEQYEKAKKEFVVDNEWYETNRPMTVLADKVGTDYATEYLNKHGVLPDPEDTFSYVMEEVKKDFPDMGKPQRTTRVASRTNRTVTNQRRQKKTLNDLPEDQRAVAKMVMESADLSEEDYLKTYEW